MSRRLRAALYEEHMRFFERAERDRRWSVSDDLPWERAVESPPDQELALCAETFFGVELLLPDYLAELSRLARDNLGYALATAGWGYEESKHSLALRQYLLLARHRSEEQLYDFEETLLAQRWTPSFTTVRQMAIYSAIQEQTTFVNYHKHEALARARRDPLLAEIYRIIGRDEVAHCRFQVRVVQLMLEEDRAGTLEDLAQVFRSFQMPAEALLPDSARRREVFVRAGIDRDSFIKEVWLKLLKQLQIERTDVPLGRART